MVDIPRRGGVSDSCFMLWNRGLQAEGKRISLTLNGAEIPAPFEFNLDKGWVDSFVVGDGGEFISEAGRIARVRIEGAIQIDIVEKTC